MVAVRRRLLTFERLALLEQAAKTRQIHTAKDAPADCSRVQGLRLDYWHGLRDILGPKCALFSRRHQGDLRAVLQDFCSLYIHTAMVGEEMVGS